MIMACKNNIGKRNFCYSCMEKVKKKNKEKHI